MIISEHSQCTGCGVCLLICPKNAIQMVADVEGFLNPKVDEDKCISCELCIKKCPVLQPLSKNPKPLVYGARLDEDRYEKDLLRSASGGIFYGLAIDTLNRGGVVVGCELDNESFIARHIMIDNTSDLRRLQGSKYVQSDLGDTYTMVETSLNSGKEVLFSGTPCQIAGVKAYLELQQVDQEKLLVVEILCHGVASPRLFKKYIGWLGRKGSLKSYNFRTNYKGWFSQGSINAYISYTNTSIDVKKHYCAITDPYMHHYLAGNIDRECCYQCQFKITNSKADISLGDFVDVMKLAPDMYTPLGLNSVYLDTEKGRIAFDGIGAVKRQFDFDIMEQKVLFQSNKRPRVRDVIYKKINELDDVSFAKQELATRIPFSAHVKAYIPKQAKDLVKGLRHRHKKQISGQLNRKSN